jgi:hypothetical protein
MESIAADITSVVHPSGATTDVARAINTSVNPDDDLNDNKVDTSITPATYGNRVILSLCSLSVIFNCFNSDVNGE